MPLRSSIVKDQVEDKTAKSFEETRKIEVSDIKQLERDLKKAVNGSKYDMAVKYLETALQYVNEMDNAARKRFASLCTFAASRITEYEGVFTLILPDVVKPKKDYLTAAKFYEFAAEFDKANVGYLHNAGICYQLAAVKEKDQFKKAELLSTAAERFDSSLNSVKSVKASPIPEFSLKQERDLVLMMSAEAYVKASIEFADLAKDDEKYYANVNECLLNAANIYAKLNEWEQLSNIELSENNPRVYWAGGGKKLADILVKEAEEANEKKDARAVAKLYAAVNSLEYRGLLTQNNIDEYLRKHKTFSEYTGNLKFLKEEWEKIKNKTLTGVRSWVRANSIVIRLARAYIAEANKKHDPVYYSRALEVLGPFNRKYKRLGGTYITERLYADIQRDIILTVNNFETVLKKAIVEVTKYDKSLKGLEKLIT